ncbi:transcriptional regulator, MarR family [Jannaschia faecimaris]|uniref:Transcriptional regulator, MarR family n=1 Tax=Jannaschia faecimaris TaxID=1244108 RepID=A0A1H3QXK2_9RHOB|nr:ROK family transcriptional regulator [Jannaschia faecimaris]SDZ17439.1 transcriptional regulator, MarR family [Jannaschia faecimaris]
MSNSVVRTISTGLSQKGVRNHNERLLLSLLLRHGSLPASDLSRRAGLSPPTVSAILKRLESDGLLERGEPVRGKVGKPSLPMRLSPDGALSWGLKIGRRSAELVLIDLSGETRASRVVTYTRPDPGEVFAFLDNATSAISAGLTSAQLSRICGIGVAAPFELQDDRETVRSGGPFKTWSGIDIVRRASALTGLPASIANDATAACQAEQVFGRGKEFRDYAYFFVGAYVGGGVVLNHSVYEGRLGNAGALGSLPTMGPNGESLQLVDTASIHLLEKRLRESDISPSALWAQPQDWSNISRHVDTWLGQIAQELARACLSICAVIDFEAILIDGAFPSEIRIELADRIRRYLANQDTRGLIPPRIEVGTIGLGARAVGAASGPISSQFLLDMNSGLAAG